MSNPSHLGLALALAVLVLAAPRPAASQAMDPWDACAAAAATAEQDAGIPPGLLLAIGKVESGRVHPTAGRVVPWPYALNIAGRGVYPPTAEAAIAEVQAARAQGLSSIDVGCFQISLLHHPGAFPTLPDAFDPARNAAYAAAFLSTLRARLASWEQAAGGYHSLTPAFGEPYAARVMATWSGAGANVAALSSAPPGQGPLLPAGSMVLPVAFRTPVARGVRVYSPGAPSPPGGTAYLTRSRLPVVYAPAQR